MLFYVSKAAPNFEPPFRFFVLATHTSLLLPYTKLICIILPSYLRDDSEQNTTLFTFPQQINFISLQFVFFEILNILILSQTRYSYYKYLMIDTKTSSCKYELLCYIKNTTDCKTYTIVIF